MQALRSNCWEKLPHLPPTRSSKRCCSWATATAEQVGRLRGKPSGHVLAQLVRRGLLRIERVGSPRRIAQYFTTARFLELFHLQSLADLPQSEELG
jgi:chromosome segregation and condensation protein ScpB